MKKKLFFILLLIAGGIFFYVAIYDSDTNLKADEKMIFSFLNTESYERMEKEITKKEDRETIIALLKKIPAYKRGKGSGDHKFPAQLKIGRKKFLMEMKGKNTVWISTRRPYRLEYLYVISEKKWIKKLNDILKKYGLDFATSYSEK